MLHLGHGHVEITPQLILQAPQHLPLVLQRLCIRDVQLEGKQTNWHEQLRGTARSEEHTSELQSRRDLVCRLLLEKKKKTNEKSACFNTMSLTAMKNI